MSSVWIAASSLHYGDDEPPRTTAIIPILWVGIALVLTFFTPLPQRENEFHVA